MSGGIPHLPPLTPNAVAQRLFTEFRERSAAQHEPPPAPDVTEALTGPWGRP